EEQNQSEGTSKRFASGVAAKLQTYAWPGNVRELKNVIQRAFIMAEDEVDPQLPAEIAVASAAQAGNAVRAGVPLAEIERQGILATLQQNNGDKRKTAAVLGIALKTLYNRLKRYGGESGTAGGATGAAAATVDGDEADGAEDAWAEAETADDSDEAG